MPTATVIGPDGTKVTVTATNEEHEWAIATTIRVLRKHARESMAGFPPRPGDR